MCGLEGREMVSGEERDNCSKIVSLSQLQYIDTPPNVQTVSRWLPIVE